MPVYHDLAALAAQIAGLTGSLPALDPRLRLAPCAAVVVAWAGPGHTAVTATCAEPPWRVLVGVRSAPASPLVRRGDTVAVVSSGDGYSVSRQAVADGDAAVGERVRLHIGALQLTGRVEADGSVTVP